jgi:hypothetical protein
MSDTNLNEKISITNSNEDNNYSAENSFINAENEHVSSSNIANNYIYLLNNDLNRLISSKEEINNHLNDYLPVFKPIKLLNNILNDSITTTTTSLSSINQQLVEPSSTNEYEYAYNKYNKNSNLILSTFNKS